MAGTNYYQDYIDNVVLDCWKNNPHTVWLFKQGYNPNFEDDGALSDIPPAMLLASAQLVNRQCEIGVLMADNPVFANAATLGPFGGYLIVDDIKGKLVLADCDVNGLNVQANATDIELAWNTCGIAAI